MFKYFKLKKEKLLLETLLLGKLFLFVDALPDLASLATKAKDMDINEIQKLIAETIVNYTRGQEEEVGE